MKKLILSLVVLAIFFSGLVYVLQNKQKSSITSTVAAAKEITISQSINLNGQDTSNFDTIKIQNGATVLDLLKKTATIKTNGEGINAFVTSIDGRSANTEKKEFWALYVNGKQAEVGAGSYKLKPSDKVLWKIETY